MIVSSANRGPRRRPLMRRGFSLLEVVIALGILAAAMVVLVDSQATAVMMTKDSQDIMTGTLLAREKMSEVVLRVEGEGFQEQDIYEEGDFQGGVFAEFERGGFDGVMIDIAEDDFEGFRWAYTIRKVDLNMAGDLGSMADDLEGSGVGPSAVQDNNDLEDNRMDLGDVGFSGDMLGDYLNPYIREVRVMVWWGETSEDEDSRVDLTTHFINPSGQMAGPIGG